MLFSNYAIEIPKKILENEKILLNEAKLQRE